MVAIYEMCGLVPRPRKCKKIGFPRNGPTQARDRVQVRLQPLRDEMGKKCQGGHSLTSPLRHSLTAQISPWNQPQTSQDRMYLLSVLFRLLQPTAM